MTKRERPTSARSGDPPSFRCPTCSLELRDVIAALQVSFVALDDDDRYPGRCGVYLDRHAEVLTELGADVAAAFFADALHVASVLESVCGADRFNLAQLGNVDRHLHWHVVPRTHEEDFPSCTPWDDPRRKTPLEPATKDSLIGALRAALTSPRVQH